jgi:hypothetical protein
MRGASALRVDWRRYAAITAGLPFDDRSPPRPPAPSGDDRSCAKAPRGTSG